MTSDKHDDEKALLGKISQRLDDSVESLDAATLSRLNQARHRALETGAQSPQRSSWIVAAAFASVFVVVSVGWLVNTSMPAQDENAVIASSEDLELIDDLEFVSWLAEQDAG
jgi:hypothetical protein